MNIIAADVGGTKARLVFTNTDKPDQVLYEARYNSQDFDSFEPLLSKFIADSGAQDRQFEGLSLALPGVVNDSDARLTNLPWTIRKQDLKDRFGVEQIHFINDFQASALGTAQLKPEDLICLNQGIQQADALRVAVGAGTGLGVSWISDDGGRPRAWSTEGGHLDFAPVDKTQMDLLRFLIDRYGHVSYERVLSGDGLVMLYAFCSGRDASDIEAAWVSEQADGNDEAAKEAMTLFVKIYGAFVGNLALLFKPKGGIYITGGIGAKIITWMKSDDFISSFLYKGRMQALAEQTSIYLVTNERVGVIGAISEAVMRAGRQQ
jgi:glucokinase